MKNLKTLFAITIIATSFTMVSCSKENDAINTDELSSSSESFLKASDFGYNLSSQDSLCINDFALEDLNEVETGALLQMREEELMAQDIYIQLYELYEYRVFDRIAKSEGAHAAAVKSLLDRYEIADPALNHQTGVYSSSAIQTLYDQLMGDAMTSGLDALLVGATIEDVDIFDLKSLLTNGVDNEDITFVFGNLLKGSENHLRAFVRALTSQDATYTPQYISQEYFDLIMSTSGNGKRLGNGGANGNGQGNGQGNGNGQGQGQGQGQGNGNGQGSGNGQG